MATNIANLAVKLSANSAQFTRGMGKSRKATKKFAMAAKGATLQVAAMAAGVTVAAVKFAKMAIEQEKAEKAMAAAMRVVGDTSKQTQRDLRAFASELQQITIFGDEALLQMMALGATMGKLSGEEVKKATVAAIGLSKAFGVELVAAMRLVARARVGDTAQLKRYGIMIDNALTPIQKFNELIKIGAKNFSLAAAEAETASGKIQQLGNVWGDVQEKIGAHVLRAAQGPGGRVTKGLQALDAFLTPAAKVSSVGDFAGPRVRRLRDMQKELRKTTAEIGRIEMAKATGFGQTLPGATFYNKQQQAAIDRAQSLRDQIFRVRGMRDRGEEFPEAVAGRKTKGLDRRKKAIASLSDVYEKVAKAYRDAMLKAEQAVIKLRGMRWRELHRQMQETIRREIVGREKEMEKWRAGLGILSQHRQPAAAIAGTAGGFRAVLRAGDNTARKQMDTLVIEQRKTREAIERAHDDWLAEQRGRLGES